MPVNIRGKQYITVAERLTAAGDDLIGVNTEVIFQEPVVIKATITTKKGVFTGISAANPNKSIEKESAYEVAETSAVGRALAFAGYETTEGIASAEEMVKVFTSPQNTTTAPKQAEDYDTTENGLCAIHSNPDGSAVALKHFEKNGREWWSHPTAKGGWCTGTDTKYNREA